MGSHPGQFGMQDIQTKNLVNALGGALVIDYFSSHYHLHVKPYLQILVVSLCCESYRVYFPTMDNNITLSCNLESQINQYVLLKHIHWNETWSLSINLQTSKALNGRHHGHMCMQGLENWRA